MSYAVQLSPAGCSCECFKLPRGAGLRSAGGEPPTCSAMDTCFNIRAVGRACGQHELTKANARRKSDLPNDRFAVCMTLRPQSDADSRRQFPTPQPGPSALGVADCCCWTSRYSDRGSSLEGDQSPEDVGENCASTEARATHSGSSIPSPLWITTRWPFCRRSAIHCRAVGSARSSAILSCSSRERGVIQALQLLCSAHAL